jgi:hypothetical protein
MKMTSNFKESITTLPQMTGINEIPVIAGGKNKLLALTQRALQYLWTHIKRIFRKLPRTGNLEFTVFLYVCFTIASLLPFSLLCLLITFLINKL